MKARNSVRLRPAVSSISAKSKRLFSFKCSYNVGRQIHVSQCHTHDESLDVEFTVCVHYISDRLLFRVVQNRSVIQLDEILVGNRVVFLPRYNTVSVRVKLREALLGVFQRVFSVDMLDPQGQLLCCSDKREVEEEKWLRLWLSVEQNATQHGVGISYSHPGSHAV